MRYLYLFGLISWLGTFSYIAEAQDLENIDDLSKRQFLELKGSFSLTSNFYISSREFNQQNPFRYILSGNPVLSVYGFDLPLSFTFANSDFTVTGPDNFQRLGMSPYYKWIKVHAGYRNIAFSPYTLNNHNFLGGGVELNPGKWRLGFIYGRFVNAIEEDTTSNQVLPPSYRRMGYSFKIGYGTSDNFVDVSVLRAKDDPGSIPDPVQSDITPASNLAVGISARKTLFKNLIWELHFGTSAYTEDITASEVQLSENRVPSFLGKIYQPYASTRMNYAGHTSLTYRLSSFSVKGEYMRIDPEYETMGSYYFNNDLERFTLAPAYTTWKGRLTMSGSLGLQRDNLLNNKAATTNRIIGSANIQVTPMPSLTVNAQYGNYATQQESGMINLNDTVRVFQINHNINITPTYMIRGERYYHNFVLSIGNQTLIDRNVFTEDFTESQTNNANFNYRLRNNMVGYGLTGGLNYLTLTSSQTEIARYGFSAGADKELWENAFSIRLQSMYNLSQRDGEPDGYVINGSLDIRYNPHPMHGFTLRGQAIFNQTSQDYTDYIISANYTFTL